LSDEDRENITLLIGSLKSSGTVTSDNFMEVCILVYQLCQLPACWCLLFT